MPEFRYKVRDMSGRPQRGVTSADSTEELAGALRARQLLVLAIDPVVHAAASRRLPLNPLAWLPPGRLDIEIGLQQLAAMLRSGLPLLESLRTTAEQARRPRSGALWRNIGQQIASGSTLAGALEVHPGYFTNYVVQLVRVGESTGELDAMLGRAAEHLEQSRNLRLMVVNALTYPVIVVLLALGVSAFLVLNVIPKIESFLSAGGRALPPITQMLLGFSHWLQAYLPQIGIGLASAAVALWAIHRWRPGRRALHRLWLTIPVIGRILRLAETAVFARGMHILIESGVALLDSLRTVERLVRNEAIGARIATAREAVTQGETLATGLHGGGEFLPMLPRMVAVGETTGSLGSILGEVARFHEAQLVGAIRRMGIVIEPALIIVVGGIVGFVYAAFFVALFSIATSS
jgi:type II secretory pathway component PulF